MLIKNVFIFFAVNVFLHLDNVLSVIKNWFYYLTLAELLKILVLKEKTTVAERAQRAATSENTCK